MKDRRAGPKTVKRAPAAAEPAPVGPADELRNISEPESERSHSTLGDDDPPAADLGRYQLLFELARGGMGTVHVARLRGAHGFDRLCAVKRLKADGASEEDVTSFLGEARLTARIKHPNVVQTLDCGEHDGLPFLVMDLVEGVSLARLQRHIAKAGDRFDPFLAAWIVSQVALGLHDAHELCDVDGVKQGLVHRDVSPENVLLSFDGRVYVADFGVAKFTGQNRQTQSGVVKGKFAYMSPEQTEALPLDRRSDIFALGIVLHECLTGKRLFDGRSMADTIRRIWQLDPPDPATLRADLPPELSPIVMRCLDRDRERRYDTAEQVGDALRGVLKIHGKTIDDRDLAELVSRYLPGAREALQARIRDAIRRAGDEDGDAAPRPAPPLEIAGGDDAPQEGSVTASVSSGPPLQRTHAGAWAAVGLAALLGTSAWLLRDDAPAPETTPPAEAPGATATVAPHASATASAAATASPSVTASPSATASASASAVASAPPVPIPRIAPAPAPSPPPPPPHTTAPKSHKGVPFKSLGD